MRRKEKVTVIWLAGMILADIYLSRAVEISYAVQDRIALSYRIYDLIRNISDIRYVLLQSQRGRLAHEISY